MLLRRIRDWWRGYSDDDMRSLLVKLAAPRRPGEVVPLTRSEWNCFRAYGGDLMFLARTRPTNGANTA